MMEINAHAVVQSFLTQESKLQNEINCKTRVLIDHLKCQMPSPSASSKFVLSVLKILGTYTQIFKLYSKILGVLK